ncbi:hypothetical protein AKJ38_04240 [candidate division MSBL1 archaeon SCGC-AAA259I14]|uniref:DUF1989 domain-containing protein n=1 Tax=candidate division MSBL1 archaeon SCGC-AAA259I14 TaxID=1698268 RepID=A0A133UP22_9EURY|nr:hypothetical protein AKJ38_04240 [candidate division MSBL1 archaeon SCGC-AAA259I14]
MKEFIIEKESARAFDVDKGEHFRIIEEAGPQVADTVFFNRKDMEETFHAGMTVFMNGIQDLGGLYHVKHLYSRPPNMSKLFTVIEDTVKRHWVGVGGCCCSTLYKKLINDPDHPNCAAQFLEAFQEYGIPVTRVPDVFNIFMNFEITDDSKYKIKPPLARKNDYIEMRAEMDSVVVISACPESIRTAPTNMEKPKPLRFQIFNPKEEKPEI